MTYSVGSAISSDPPLLPAMPLPLRFSLAALLLVLAPDAMAQDLAPRVYPNPVSGVRAVTVELGDAEDATVEVIDVLGRIVAEDVPLAAGTYLVRARYADGRVTRTTPITVATDGPVEFRLDRAVGAQAEAGPLVSADKRGPGMSACDEDEIFGGFYFQENRGTLTRRPADTPENLRVDPDRTNTSDFTTCFGEVQGAAFRYLNQRNDPTRLLRILSPRVVGNTAINYRMTGVANMTPYTTDFGFSERFIDNGTNPNRPAIEFLLDSPFFAGGLGLYQLIVKDANENVVYRMNEDGADGLFFTSTGRSGRINLLQSIVLGEAVDGFRVTGGRKPGDLTFAFEFASDGGGPVNVHVGEGAPIATGTVVEITPKFDFDDIFEPYINTIQTQVRGARGFGLRALRFAAGGSRDAFFGSEAQFTRVTNPYTSNQLTMVTDAQLPMAMVGASSFGSEPVYGLQFGFEPGPLEETGSQEIGAGHDPGVTLADVGDLYRGTAVVRNISETQPEIITAEIVKQDPQNVTVEVNAANSSFATYSLILDYDGDGTPEEVNSGLPVDVPVVFCTQATFFSSGASDRDDQYADISPSQDFFLGAQMDIGFGPNSVAYIFPDFATPNADVNVRAYSIEANQPWKLNGVRERDTMDPPGSLTIFGQKIRETSSRKPGETHLTNTLGGR